MLHNLIHFSSIFMIFFYTNLLHNQLNLTFQIYIIFDAFFCFLRLHTVTKVINAIYRIY